MGGRQDRLPLELFMQLPMSTSVQGKGRAVHETPQVVVFVKIGNPVLHLVCVKVGFHIGYLNVGLEQRKQFSDNKTQCRGR